jgi:predicted short-subunit dehydrogenase-like oxidoreductase (DUF2520 family)
VFVAVQDRELDAALAPLAAARLAPGTPVLQASGSAEPAAFAGLRARGVPCGTFHPLVPLAAPEEAPALLRGAWVGTEGDPAALAAAAELAGRVGAHVLRIPGPERAKYHAAAVFASNFPVVLAAVAERLLTDAGVPMPSAGAAVRHLLSAAAANLARSGDVTAALTGPIVRGDADTVRRHVLALADDAEALTLYRDLARATLGVATPSTTSGHTAAAITRSLDPDAGSSTARRDPLMRARCTALHRRDARHILKSLVELDVRRPTTHLVGGRPPGVPCPNRVCNRC